MAIAVSIASPCLAQENVDALGNRNTPDQVSTLREALFLTFLNNPALRAERADLRAVQEEYPQAISGFLPSVTANTAINAINISGDEITGASDGAVAKEFGFTISQPIYSGGTTFAEKEEALNNINAARAGLADEEQSIFQDVVEAYLNVIRDRASLESQMRNERILEKRLENSDARFEAGEATKTNVSQARAQLARAQSERLDAEVDLNASTENFINLVGVPPSDNLDLPALLGTIPPTREQAEEMAIANNPEIIEAQYDYLSAKNTIRAEYGELLPQVSLSATMKNESDPSPTNAQSRRENRIGLSASLPIFQGGDQRSQIREAKITANQRRLELFQKIRDVEENVKDTWIEYKSAQSRVKLREIEVRAAQEARDGVAKEVDAGERLFIDLLDADQDLLEAELSLILAKRSSILERFNLLVLMGQLTANTLSLDEFQSVYNPDTHLASIRDGKGFFTTDTYEDTNEEDAAYEKKLKFFEDKEREKKAPGKYNGHYNENGEKSARTENLDTDEKATATAKTVPGINQKDDQQPEERAEALANIETAAGGESDKVTAPAPTSVKANELTSPPKTKTQKNTKEIIIRQNQNAAFEEARVDVLNMITPSAGFAGQKARLTGFETVAYTPYAKYSTPVPKLPEQAEPSKADIPVEAEAIAAEPGQPQKQTAQQIQKAVSGNIYIQVGAFGSFDNAMNYAQQMERFGVANILPSELEERELYRVRLGPFNKVLNAQDTLAELSVNNIDGIIIEE